MVDSDNVVVGDDWLSRMVAPFEDPEVVSSEALRWDYRREDHFVNRYQALTGINDPTGAVRRQLRPLVGADRALDRLPARTPSRATAGRGSSSTPRYVPTMGANGYIVRRARVRRRPGRGLPLRHRLRLRPRAARRGRLVARVDVPIRHYFCDCGRALLPQDPPPHRRLLLLRRAGPAQLPVDAAASARASCASSLSTVLVVPLLVDVARGCAASRDPAWLFHVPACWITLGVYAAGTSADGSRRRCSTGTRGASERRKRQPESAGKHGVHRRPSEGAFNRGTAIAGTAAIGFRLLVIMDTQRGLRPRASAWCRLPVHICGAKSQYSRSIAKPARVEQRAHPFRGEREEVPRRVVAVPVPAEDARRERAGVGRSEVEHTVGREQRAQVLERLERLGDVLDHVPQARSPRGPVAPRRAPRPRRPAPARQGDPWRGRLLLRPARARASARSSRSRAAAP